ncbi:fas-binding factor 1 homolog [Neosynchiropus ocellatus]
MCTTMMVLTTFALLLRHRFANKIWPQNEAIEKEAPYQRTSGTSAPNVPGAFGAPRETELWSEAVTDTSATDNILSMLEEELKHGGGDSDGSDVSAADPDAILQTLKDMDDMDADLFAPKKRSVLVPRPRTQLNHEALREDSVADTRPAAGDEAALFKEPSRAGRNSGTKTSSDEPLSGLLTELLPRDSKAPAPPPSSLLSPDMNKPSQRRAEITFEDDKDDLMDALGFDRDEKEPKRKEAALWSNKARRSDPPQRARTKVDEILDGLSSSHLSSERKDQEDGKPRDRTPSARDDGLTLGSYQPTIGSELEGRQSRRQSVRFSNEDVSVSTPERKASRSQASRPRGSADWLGLKTDDGFLEDDAKDEKFSVDSPLSERKSSLTTAQTTPPAEEHEAPSEATAKVPETGGRDEDDWLRGALSRKKHSPEADVHEEQPRDLAAQVHLEPCGSQLPHAAPKPNTVRPAEHRGAPIRPALSAGGRLKECSHNRNKSGPVLQWFSSRPGRPLTGRRRWRGSTYVVPAARLVWVWPPYVKAAVVCAPVQAIPSQLPGSVEGGAVPRLEDLFRGDHQALQLRVSQLEGQVKTLQLERDRSYSLLESIQQRHRGDVELLESTHSARVKLLEESAAQREARLQTEYDDLVERMAAQKQAAEDERAQLQVLHQRKLSQAQQDRDREVERLRELQRKSILEMKKDHEDQVRRLKKLKEEEIDAVTSATSQTRCLTAVIEQMEHFSSKLGEISSRVESTHEHTAHDLEQGARHRDEQLRIMQDRVAQQQRSMTEERAYLKEIISRMDTQISEQQRQLEKERWKVSAEQAKAESTLRGLEEERRSLSMQITVEREEMDRAKSALLEEQKSVMQQCTEERRKLAAEWSRFHAQEKGRQERADRAVSSLLEKREDSIMSLAQEQAEWKLRAAELKQKEASVTQEREQLERLREELDLEKQRISSSALRLKTRVQEVEAFSQLAADKYQQGERALQEATRVQLEHEARLKNIHMQTERLRRHETRVLQERLREQRRPALDVPRAAAVPGSDGERARKRSEMFDRVFASHYDSVSPRGQPSPAADTFPPRAPDAQAMALAATLALWKHTAAKDRQYLEEEQLFLENLKKKPYRWTSGADP